MLHAPKYIKRRSVHSGRLERWLGPEKIARISNQMLHGGGYGHNWYGPPIELLDIPGNVAICGDGDFVGSFDRGGFASAADNLFCHFRNLWRLAGKPIYIPEPEFGVGFTGIADLIERERTGYKQKVFCSKEIFSSTTFNDLWGTGTVPPAGAIGSAAPGGRAPTKATTGAVWFNNPSSGTLHLIGADFSNVKQDHSVIIYDRIFDVAKTMNSTATEAVTGVPTRYQSTTVTDPDYVGGNFLFPRAATALDATVHNWTVCLYVDQDGNAGATLPSTTGRTSAAIHNVDVLAGRWFCPLESGDTGIKALTQMQCSALVATGTIDFVIGHPIGVMAFPIISAVLPFEWYRSREQAPRVFNDACLSFLAAPASAGTVALTGCLSLVNAP